LYLLLVLLGKRRLDLELDWSPDSNVSHAIVITHTLFTALRVILTNGANLMVSIPFQINSIN